jgi:predicted ATPase
MSVSVSLFGGFAASVDGAAVPDGAWRLKKARELVKLLALARGHRLHREVAMDRLWPDLAPAAAANNLNQAVHVARRALGADTIQLRDEVLSLAAEVDVDEFELAAENARRTRTTAAHRAALALYRGELLPENRYDDWAEERRDELAALAAELTEQAAALGDASGVALPAETSSFVGRERELEELAALLERTRLLSLCGTGGVGKTRLALELARGAASRYESGAVLVELGNLDDARLVPDAVARALDVRPLVAQAPLDAVVDFLAPRTLLLVIDNCEHVLGASASLADALLRAAPRLTIVATSREPLRVAGEVVFRVPSLDIPDPGQSLEPERLLGYEAVSLFVERAAAAAPGFALDADNAADVVRICLRLDGLPLALELAAARLGALSPAAISERVDDRFRLLRSGSQAAPTRQQTLLATLQWSHELLEPDEQVMFRRLATFAGGFELEAVEDVCAGDDLEAGDVADALARLVEKSLVAVERADGVNRYRLLETVRVYARARLEEAGEQAPLAGRHARWALAVAQGPREPRQLEREAANLRVALDTLLVRDPTTALRLCVALTPFWLGRIELEEARRRFAQVLQAAPERTLLRAETLLASAAIHFRSGTLTQAMTAAEESYAVAHDLDDTCAQWRALQFLGEIGVASDEADVACPWFEQALELARAEGFDAAEALGVHSLGIARWMSGDLETAEELVAESVERFRALEVTGQTTTTPLSVAEIRTGRPGLELIFEDTLQLFFEISCAAAVGYALANQAGIARARGQLDRAGALLEESAARFVAVGDDAGRAAVLVRSAYFAVLHGDLEVARERFETALDLRTTLRDRRGRGLVLVGLGLLETTAGDYEAAERYLSEAQDSFRRAGDRWALAATLWRIADLELAQGRLDDAEAALDEAHAVLRVTQRERWIANTLSGLAEVALRRGDVERATSLLADARERYAARDDAHGLATVEERLAQLQSGR